jgi:phosphatidylserine/phosphatidylglycerophosphate/cardiolipin synthase-like enzyme
MIRQLLQSGFLLAVAAVLAVPAIAVSQSPEEKITPPPQTTPHHSAVYFAPYGGYAEVNYNKKVETKAPNTGDIRVVPGDLSNPLVNLIRNAKESIDIASYIYSPKAPAHGMLLAAYFRGVKVRLFLDSLFLDTFMIEKIKNYRNPLPIKTLDPKKAEEITGIPFTTMHEKFGIIDGKHVFNGSSNISLEANLKYTESRFFFYDNPEMVKVFQEEFDRLWEMGTWLVNPEELKKKKDESKENEDK